MSDLKNVKPLEDMSIEEQLDESYNWKTMDKRNKDYLKTLLLLIKGKKITMMCPSCSMSRTFDLEKELINTGIATCPKCKIHLAVIEKVI